MSRLGFLPVLVALALYGLVGGPPTLVGALAVLLLLPQLVAVRASLSKIAQVVLALVLFAAAVAVLATALAGVRRPIDELATPWAAAAGGALTVAVSRSYVAEPTGGMGVTVAIALIAVTACGGAITGALYPVWVVLFLGSAALAMRGADPARAPWRALGDRRYLVVAATMLATTGGLAIALGVALPPIHSWAVTQLMLQARARAGFSDKLQLGSIRDMQSNEEKVLRIHGDGADYLRGMTYTRYVRGRWTRAREDDWSPTEAPIDLEGDDVIAIDIISGDPKHYFVPLDANDVAMSSGITRIDRSAVLAPIAANPATRIQYRRDAPRRFPLGGPDVGDLDVPEDLTIRLRAMALAWTEHATTPQEKVASIESRLRSEYDYTLNIEVEERRDPVAEFLLRTKAGHCEYFASALAILSRLAGVPARVVGGYRVTEYNEVGGYFIVRERDAHAWVEAYLPDRGWTTFDATPPDATVAPRSSTTAFLRGFLDLFGAGYQRFLIWLDRRTIPEILTLTGAGILFPLLIRWLIERRRRRKVAGAAIATDPPLPCLERLMAALGARGIVKPIGETLEHLASRLPLDAPLPATLGDRASALLLQYSALRYGGIGQEDDLDHEISRFCRDLEQRR